MISLISLGNLLSAIVTGAKKDGEGIIKSTLKDEKKINLMLTGGRLDNLLGDTIITPTIVVDNTLRGTPELEDILKLHVEMFVSKYTNALKYLTDIEGVELESSLRLLSTHKERRIQNISASSLYSPESESFECLEIKELPQESFESKPGEVSVTHYAFIVKYSKKVGSKYSLTEKDAEVTIDCRAIIKYAEAEEILELYDATDPSKTRLGSQLVRIFTGLAGFVKDLIFSSTISRDKRARRLKLKEGLLADLEKRTMHARNVLLREGAYGFGAYFNMFIINEQSESAFKSRLGGPVEQHTDRLLKTIKSLSVTFVDTQYESLDIHGESSTTVSFKQIKSGKASEMTELIKYMTQRGL